MAKTPVRGDGAISGNGAASRLLVPVVVVVIFVILAIVAALS